MAETENLLTKNLTIIFGLNLDGETFSEQKFGQIVFGKLGFLQFLSERQGIQFEMPVQGERILAYYKAISTYIKKDKNTFFAKSFEKDAWATAKTLLSWRDNLAMGGWLLSKRKFKEPRLQQLAEIEKTEIASETNEQKNFCFKNGFEDKLTDLINNQFVCHIPVEKIILKDNLNHLPFLWQKLLDKLEKTGIKIIQDDNSNCKFDLNNENDCKKITCWEADNEYIAASAVAEWLAQGENEKNSLNKDVTIIVQNGSNILNAELKKRNLPTVNDTNISSQRSNLQILPALIDLMDGPFSVQKMYTFLNLPKLPISHAYELKNTLNKKSGKTKEWIETVQKLNNKNTYINPEDNEKTETIVTNLTQEEQAFLLNLPQSNPKISIDIIEKAVNLLIKWADPKNVFHEENNEDASKLTGDEKKRQENFSKEVVHQSQLFLKIVKGLNQNPIDILQVKKILKSITESGMLSPEADTLKASSYSVLTGPEQLLTKTQTLLWHGFKDVSVSKGIYPWSNEEISDLNTNDISPDTPKNIAQRITNEWKNTLKFAEKIIIVLLKSDKGDEVLRHPFGDEIIGKSTPKYSIDLSNDGNLELEGRKITINIVKSENNKTTDNSVIIQTDKNANFINEEYTDNNVKKYRKESATSLQELLSCPLKWYFSRYLQIEEPFYGMVQENLSYGNLAHSVFENLAKAKILNKASDTKIEEQFDIVIQEFASHLDAPENVSSKAMMLKKLKSNVKLLQSFINKNNLEVVDAEYEVSKDIKTAESENAEQEKNNTIIPIYGKIDLVLKDKDNNYIILDYKNSSKESYIDNFKENKSVQLPLYATAYEMATGNTVAAVGYFLLGKNTITMDNDKYTQIGIDEVKSIEPSVPKIEENNEKNINTNKTTETNSNQYETVQNRWKIICKKLVQQIEKLQTGEISEKNIDNFDDKNSTDQSKEFTSLENNKKTTDETNSNQSAENISKESDKKRSSNFCDFCPHSEYCKLYIEKDSNDDQ